MEQGEAKGLQDVALAVDGLVLFMRASMRRALLAMIACVSIVLVCAACLVVLVVHASAQQSRIDELTRQLSEMAAHVDQIGKATEDTRSTVVEAKAEADKKPSVDVELRPAGSAKPASAVVVITPPKKPARLFSDSPPAAPAPSIEIAIPVKEAK